MSDQEKSYDTALAERTLEVGHLQRALGKKNRQNFKLRETIGELNVEKRVLLELTADLEAKIKRLYAELDSLHTKVDELSGPRGVHIGPKFFSMKRDPRTNTWHLDI